MFFLAIRHLFSRKKQTLLTFLGIVLGTAAYVAISGMMLGFQTFIIDQLVNNDSHIRIQAREEILTSQVMNQSFFDTSSLISWIKPPAGRKDNSFILAPQEWLDRLNKDERVLAASPQLVVQGIATYGAQTVSVSIVGSEPEKQKRVSNIEAAMIKGRFTDIGNTGNRVIIGNALAKKLGISEGETIQLSVGKQSPQPFKVVGLFHLGVKNIDETRIFAALKDTQQLNQTPSRISDIALRLVDVNLAADLAQSFNLYAQEKVQSWDQSNEGIMSVFKTQDIVRNAMTVSILVVAGFGIYNILSLAVTHKRREIAILRSMGFEPWDITELFLIQGVILGFTGGLMGLGVGLFISYLMSTIEVSSNRGLGGNTMMISYDVLIYVKAFFLALSSSTFAGYFPARAAGKMEPIDIIRGEG
jgi:lipoprotein-releasing system permease protein